LEDASSQNFGAELTETIRFATGAVDFAESRWKGGGRKLKLQNAEHLVTLIQAKKKKTMEKNCSPKKEKRRPVDPTYVASEVRGCGVMEAKESI
jgi:hypothetical protein